MRKILLNVLTHREMKRLGTTLFWTGFIITICIIVFFIIMMLINVTTYASWFASLFLCGVVLLGSVLMLIGRGIERKSSEDVWRKHLTSQVKLQQNLIQTHTYQEIFCYFKPLTWIAEEKYNISKTDYWIETAYKRALIYPPDCMLSCFQDDHANRLSCVGHDSSQPYRRMQEILLILSGVVNNGLSAILWIDVSLGGGIINN